MGVGGKGERGREKEEGEKERERDLHLTYENSYIFRANMFTFLLCNFLH